MTHFVGILDGSGDVWGVRFPDLPGCHGGGATAEEAIADGISAMREWAEHRSSKNAALPVARSIHDIIAAGEIEPGEVTILAPLLMDSGRTVRANLSIDAALLEAIDDAAKLRGLTRSAFIASAAREKIAAEA